VTPLKAAAAALQAELEAWLEELQASGSWGPTAPPVVPDEWDERAFRLEDSGGTLAARPPDGWAPCGYCHGSDDGRRLAERDHPTLGYRHVVSVPCHCGPMLLRRDRLRQAGIPARFKGRGGDFAWDGYSDSATIRAAIEALVGRAKWPPRRGVLLYGPPGTGKSTLAGWVAILAALRHAATVAWLDWPDFCEAMSAEKSLPREVSARLRAVDLLVVDEYGGQRDTEFRREVFDRTVGARFEDGRPCVMTTNLDPRPQRALLGEDDPLDLKGRLGERAYSRLRGACDCVLVDGPDRRER